jgi:hypothetical protein
MLFPRRRRVLAKLRPRRPPGDVDPSSEDGMTIAPRIAVGSREMATVGLTGVEEPAWS